MMKWLGCLGVLVVIALIVGGLVLGVYNDLVGKGQAVDAQWGQVENVYQRRADLIPNLVATVKGAADFEKSTLESVVSARKQHALTYGILGNMDSAIASQVDKSIHLPGTTKLCRDDEPDSLQMAGSLFEQSAFFFFESVALNLYKERKEEVGRVSSRHTVIE